jgi:hypothetical protein
MSRTTKGRRQPSPKVRQFDRNMIFDVVSLIIRMAEQALLDWIGRGGHF